MPKAGPRAAKAEVTRPYAVAEDSVYVSGTNALDTLKRATDTAEKILASDVRIQLTNLRFELGTEDPDAVILTFAVPGVRERRWLTNERLAGILEPAPGDTAS